MGFFSLDKKEDRDFLASRINKATGKSLLQEQIDHETKILNDKSIGFNIEKSTEVNAESASLKKGNKYGNRVFKRYGYTWRSEYECQVYLILVDLQRIGSIKNLKVGVIFRFVHNNIKIARYIADFTFEVNDKLYIWDAKHRQTERQLKFLWQRKMMKAFFDLEITCVYKNETNIVDLIDKYRNNGLQT